LEINPSSSNHRSIELEAVAAPLVTLHVAAYAKSLTAAGMWALERFLSGVGVAVDPETAGSAEGLVASRTDISILALWKSCSTGWVEVVVMLPGV
jgi:hypothetical protein